MLSRGEIACIVGGVLLAASTCSEESWSRYHADSLRKERFTTTRILGFPVRTETGIVEDAFPGVFTQITKEDLDPDRWLKMRPDYVRSLLRGGPERCYGYPSDLRERHKLLTALFQQYQATSNRERAKKQLEQVDRVASYPSNSRHEIDVPALDELRKELGLKPYIDM